jgi:hypothetical protein
MEPTQTTVDRPRLPAQGGKRRPPENGKRRNPHRASKVQLLERSSIDSRCGAAKTFDRIVVGIQNDLGGRDQLSTVEAALIEAFAGATVHVNQLNALLLLGTPIDLADHAAAISAMVRVAARIGLRRRPRDVTPSVAEYVAHINTTHEEAEE